MKHLFFLLLLAFTLISSCTSEESGLKCYNFELKDKGEVLDFENQRGACIQPDSISPDFADYYVNSVELMDNGVARYSSYSLSMQEVLYNFEASENASAQAFLSFGCSRPSGLLADAEMLTAFIEDLVESLKEDYGDPIEDTTDIEPDGASRRYVVWRASKMKSNITLYYASFKSGVIFSNQLNSEPW